jgi:hypothetical protein
MSFTVNKTSLNTSYEYDADSSLTTLYNYDISAYFSAYKKIGSQDFNTLLKTDQIAYGARFNTLVSLGRDEGDTGGLRPIVVDNRDTDTDYWDMIVPPMLYTIPSPIPGSAGVSGTTTGTSLADRGGLSCWSRGKDVIIQYRIQRCTLDGTGGIVLAGTPSIGVTVHGASYSWQGTEDQSTGPGPAPFLLYPAGSEPGDMFRIIVSARQSDPAEPGYLSALLVHETPLSATRP